MLEQWQNLTRRSGVAECYSTFVYVSVRSDLRIMVRHCIVCKYRNLYLILEFYPPYRVSGIWWKYPYFLSGFRPAFAYVTRVVYWLSKFHTAIPGGLPRPERRHIIQFVGFCQPSADRSTYACSVSLDKCCKQT